MYRIRVLGARGFAALMVPAAATSMERGVGQETTEMASAFAQCANEDQRGEIMESDAHHHEMDRPACASKRAG